MPLAQAPISVLLVDASPDERARLEAILRTTLPQVVLSSTVPEQAELAVHRDHPAAVLFDLASSPQAGLSLVKVLRATHPEIAVIVLTTPGNETAAVTAIAHGAASYIPKDMLAQDLWPTLQQVINLKVESLKHEKLFEHAQAVQRHFLIPNNRDLIGPLVSLLQEDLRQMSVCPPEDLIRFGVSITETLVNAMVHGNLEVSSGLIEEGYEVFHGMISERVKLLPYSARRVTVISSITREQARFTVRDEGRGFDPGSLPDPTHPDNVGRAYGRGLLLIRSFMDEVHHNARGNEITMVKNRVV